MWSKEVALSIIPLIVLNAFILGALILFVVLRALGKIDVSKTRDEKFRTTAVLGATLRDFWPWFTGPVERLLIAAHVTPNLISTAGFLLSCVAAVFYYMGHVGTAGYIIIFGATCDSFDGRVARATGQQTKSGAFYDAVLDRVGEAAVFMGIAAYFEGSFVMYIPIAALLGSLMVSYVKARAEAMGVACKEGLMQRPERLFLLCITSLFDPLVKAIGVEFGFADVHYLLIAAVAVIAALSWYTFFQRLYQGFNAVYDAFDKEKAEEEASAVAGEPAVARGEKKR